MIIYTICNYLRFSSLVIVVAACILFPSHGAEKAPNFGAMISQVVLIKTDTAQGSGVLIKSELDENLNPVIWVATNAHVVESASNVRVMSKLWERSAQIVFADGDYDVAFLRLTAEMSEVAVGSQLNPPSSVLPSVGTRVYAVGSPLGLEATITDGIVSGFRNYRDKKFLQTSAPISSGSSGGALFDSSGKILGMTTFKLKNAENLNFAIPWRTVERLFEASRLAFKLTRRYEVAKELGFVRWLAEIDLEGDPILIPKVNQLIYMSLNNLRDPDKKQEISRKLDQLVATYAASGQGDRAGQTQSPPPSTGIKRINCALRLQGRGDPVPEMWFELNEANKTVTMGNIKNIPAKFSPFEISFATNTANGPMRVSFNRSDGSAHMAFSDPDNWWAGKCSIASPRGAF